MLINGTEVQLSQNETREVSCLYGHIHFHGREYAQKVADLWVAQAHDEDAKQRRQEATRALSLNA